MAGILAASVTTEIQQGDETANNAVSGFITGEAITFSVTPVGSAYTWTLTRPGGATSRGSLSSSDGQTTMLIPDQGGFWHISAIVDGTRYNLTLSVTQVNQATSVEAIRYSPKPNASVPTPLLGAALYYSEDDGELVFKDTTGTVSSLRGATGIQGPAAPKSFTAQSAGILVANTGAQNYAAYEAWRTNSAYNVSELVFGETGTYLFNNLLSIPAGRKLRGISPEFVTLRYNGSANLGAGTAFISAGGSPARVEDIIVSVRDGATLNGLLDYGIASVGTLSPNVAGPTLYGKKVYVQFAAVAQWYGLNSSVILDSPNAYGGQYSYWLDGCSESSILLGFASNWTGAAIRNRGLYAAGSGLTNGGKLTVEAFVGGTTGGSYGLDIDGTANCVVTGCTIEGSTVAAYYIHGGSTNVRITGTRSNAGAHVIFDDCNNARVDGSCSSGQASTGVYYRNNARNCRAAVVVETDAGHFDVTQRWGVREWQGWVRDVGGPVISVANNAPTDGYWEIGNRVIPKTAAVGFPREWACTLNGQPCSMQGNPALTFTNVGGSGDTIFRSSGSWIDDGFIVGSGILVSGTSSNNLTVVSGAIIADMTASTLTLGVTPLTNEGPVSNVTVTGTGTFLSLGNV